MNTTIELEKVTEGEEASEPDFFYIDKYSRVYYGHTKEPNFCEGEDIDFNIGDFEHEPVQLVWNGSNQYCPLCVKLNEVKEYGLE